MENVNVRVIEQKRAQINKFGTVFGTGVFTPKKEGVVTDFNARKQNLGTHDLFITRNLNRYKVNIVNITGINYAKDAEGEDIVRISGVDSAGKEISPIDCEINNSQFTKDPTTDNLRDALDSGKPAFFKSGRKMKDEVNSLNYKELDRVNKLIAELEAARDAIKTTIKINDEKVDDYYKQLDGKTSGDLNYHIHATVE